jgi:hypothetical protein
MSANASMVIDRGLPTDNLNNTAGSDRANVAWAFRDYTPEDYWLVGDTFANTSAQSWAINSIRLWTTSPTATPSLWGGINGLTIGVVSASGVISSATYADLSSYQTPLDTYRDLKQIDFAVNILLAPGQTYNFFFDGTGNNQFVVPFVHASNAARSGSPQQGADDSMLAANVVGGSLISVETWTSLGNGWDKASDVNVQVFGTPVPEPSTYLAGVLLLLPFGINMMRGMRKNRAA